MNDVLWSRIQGILTKRGMTANQLSHAIGYRDNGQIYALKNGRIKRPSFEMIYKICKVLDISLDYLVAPTCVICGDPGTLQLENGKWICDNCALIAGEKSGD